MGISTRAKVTDHEQPTRPFEQDHRCGHCLRAKKQNQEGQKGEEGSASTLPQGVRKLLDIGMAVVGWPFSPSLPATIGKNVATSCASVLAFHHGSRATTKIGAFLPLASPNGTALL